MRMFKEICSEPNPHSLRTSQMLTQNVMPEKWKGDYNIVNIPSKSFIRLSKIYYQSEAGPRKVFFVWNPTWNKNFVANCTASIDISSCSGPWKC